MKAERTSHAQEPECRPVHCQHLPYLSTQALETAGFFGGFWGLVDRYRLSDMSASLHWYFYAIAFFISIKGPVVLPVAYYTGQHGAYMVGSGTPGSSLRRGFPFFSPVAATCRDGQTPADPSDDGGNAVLPVAGWGAGGRCAQGHGCTGSIRRPSCA